MLHNGINMVPTINVNYQFQIEVAVSSVALDGNENNAWTFDPEVSMRFSLQKTMRFGN